MNKPQNSYIDKGRASALLSKWGKVLDYQSERVAPIVESNLRLNTAILLENQENWCAENGGLVRESGNSYGGGALGANAPSSQSPAGFSQDSYATGDARLPKVLIPMIRRTFPELITNEIVGVQPMSGPVGLAFALRYKYEGEALGSRSNAQGNSSRTADTRGSAVSSPADGKEVGYNDLDTRFTGTSSDQFSGDADGNFTMIGQDQGIADLLAAFELNDNIPQMVISFEKTAVEAGTRRLAAKWSVELEQDVRNMNGIDIDNEMTNAMSYEIQAEIDREMIMRMVQVTLSAGHGQGYTIWEPASADARWSGERNRHFYQKLLVEANRVAIRNRRGAANFIVATPNVCAMLEALPEFAFMPVSGNVNTQPVGIAKLGTLAGRFNIYRDTRTEAQYQQGQRTAGQAVDYALLGYKGPEFFDTGIIYCPYIPVMIQRTIDPVRFNPITGLMTRYGVVDHLFGADLFYHTVIVKNLDVAFTPGETSVFIPDLYV
tara:strand:+ start:92014 stop:93486 length:1473 start_codon:yes stop_codon:yes gene_type:complete